MGSVSCPHCTSGNDHQSSFCQACGKALPSAFASGPRVVLAGQFATTSAGTKLQSEELEVFMKKAGHALLTVAVVQTLLGVVIYAMLQGKGSLPAEAVQTTVAIVLAIAVLFWGLYFWARVNPLPAGIVGLVVYITLWAIDFAASAGNMANAGSPGNPSLSNPFSGIVVKIVIIAMLVRAIQAGSMYRKLQRHQQSSLAALTIE